MAQRFTLRIGDHLKTPETKRYYNEKVFTEIARKYDFITRALSFWRDSHWKRDLIASLPPGESPLCVDLACGTGDIAFLLAGKYPQGRIVGLDITESMLDLARRRNTFPNVRFASQDMARIEFAAESVDIITGGTLSGTRRTWRSRSRESAGSSSRGGWRPFWISRNRAPSSLSGWSTGF